MLGNRSAKRITIQWISEPHLEPATVLGITAQPDRRSLNRMQLRQVLFIVVPTTHGYRFAPSEHGPSASMLFEGGKLSAIFLDCSGVMVVLP